MPIIDVIQHPNERSDEMVFRVPQQGAGEFAFGTQLIVREGQAAVFYRDGKALDVFGPGRHTLSTNNLPLLAGLMGIPFGGRTPFTAEVYFVSQREFSDLKWGTAQPVVFRDRDLGMVRLRAFGTYAFRIADPALFVQQSVGARGIYTTGMIEDSLRGLIVTEFNDLLGDVHTSLLDLPARQGELAAAMRNALVDDFRRLGLDLVAFQIVAVTPPEDVQRRIDERSASALPAAPERPQPIAADTALAGGEPTLALNPPQAARGVGAGHLGTVDAAEVGRETSQDPARLGKSGAIACPHCRAVVPMGSRFCPNCGRRLHED